MQPTLPPWGGQHPPGGVRGRGTQVYRAGNWFLLLLACEPIHPGCEQGRDLATMHLACRCALPPGSAMKGSV